LHSGITRWVSAWQQRGWRTSDGKEVKHRDLWKALLAAAAPYQVSYHLISDAAEPAEMTQTQKLARAAKKVYRSWRFSTYLSWEE
jgi:ribonuclease HI